MKAHASFYKGLQEMKGDKSKNHVAHGNIQISFFVGGAFAAKYTPEGEGLEVIAGICTGFSFFFFEAVVNSVCRLGQGLRPFPD